MTPRLMRTSRAEPAASTATERLSPSRALSRRLKTDGPPHIPSTPPCRMQA